MFGETFKAGISALPYNMVARLFGDAPSIVLNLMLLGSALASDRSNPRNRWFAYLALALGIWSFGVLGLRWSHSPAVAPS